MQGLRVMAVVGKQPPVITDAQARTVATYWRDLQTPDAPLSLLASTGAIAPSLEGLLGRDLASLELATSDIGSEAPSAAQAQVRALLRYVQDRGTRGPVPGWGDLPHCPWEAPASFLSKQRGHEAFEDAPLPATFDTMYEKIGGGQAVSEIVETFYRAILADPSLVPYFDGIDVHRIKAHQYAFLSAATGGPEYYVGRSMKRVHRGLRISGEHFDRMIGHLVTSLEALGADAPTVEAVVGKLTPFRDDIAVPPEAE
jgi:hemoglobin